MDRCDRLNSILTNVDSRGVDLTAIMALTAMLVSCTVLQNVSGHMVMVILFSRISLCKRVRWGRSLWTFWFVYVVRTNLLRFTVVVLTVVVLIVGVNAVVAFAAF